MALIWSDVRALAFDYDGTLARDGVVAPATTRALERARAVGRKLLLVTGREARHLRELYPGLELFQAIVTENGASLYWPALGEERALAPPPPPALIAELARRRVEPLSAGRTILSTPVENEAALREAIAAAEAPWRTIRNKTSVMALPYGVDKASGLVAALGVLGLATEEVLAIGDAENDEPFMAICGAAAAPANALPAVKAIADLVMRGADGDGVVELLDKLLADGRRTSPHTGDEAGAGQAGR